MGIQTDPIPSGIRSYLLKSGTFASSFVVDELRIVSGPAFFPGYSTYE